MLNPLYNEQVARNIARLAIKVYLAQDEQERSLHVSEFMALSIATDPCVDWEATLHMCLATMEDFLIAEGETEEMV